MAEGAPLLREYVGKTCIEGSNPSGSARTSTFTGLSGPLCFPAPIVTPMLTGLPHDATTAAEISCSSTRTRTAAST